MTLPVVGEVEHVKPAGPASPAPCNVKVHRVPHSDRRWARDDVARRTSFDIRDDLGRKEFTDHGLITDAVKWERYTITDGDPLSATCDIGWTHGLARGNWSAETRTTTRLSSDTKHYHLTAKVTATEAGEEVFTKSWHKKIERR